MVFGTYYDVFWNVLIVFRTFWLFLVLFLTVLINLRYYRCFLEFFDGFWIVLMVFGTFWWFFERFLMIFRQRFDGFGWNFDRFGNFLVVFRGWWVFLMVGEFFWRFSRFRYLFDVCESVLWRLYQSLNSFCRLVLRNYFISF